MVGLARIRSVGLLALTLVLVLALSAGPASATTAEGQHLFDTGAYRQAAEAVLGQAAGAQADGQAFAARALLAYVSLAPLGQERDRALAQAEAHARRAILLDPEHVEGRLQLAVALGYRGRADGPMVAHLAGLAGEAREQIDAALAVAPDNPFALAIDGAWHLEIVAGAGPVMADLFYGATLDKGQAAFQAARSQAPNNLLFDVQYAVALLSFGVVHHRDAVLAMLDAARAKTPHDALSAHYQASATALHTALSANDAAAVQELVATLQGITPVETLATTDDLRD